MDIEIVFLIVAIIFYIAVTIILLRFERKELRKMSTEKLKKRIPSGMYLIVFLLILGSISFFLSFDYIISNAIILANKILWGFLAIYFFLLDILIIKRILKQRNDIEDK